MLYKRHNNLSEKFKSDRASKLNKGIISKDFESRPCNCNPRTLIEGECPYGGKCNTPLIVYKIKCRDCNMEYVGSTQRSYKTRMSGHFSDVRRWFRDGQQTDSFAKHFAQHFDSKPTPAEIRAKCDFSVLQQVNPFSFMKRVRTYNCILCLGEKSWIAKKRQKFRIINENSEIYGSCKHRAKFHRFSSCTDEHGECEKSRPTAPSQTDTESENSCFSGTESQPSASPLICLPALT